MSFFVASANASVDSLNWSLRPIQFSLNKLYFHEKSDHKWTVCESKNTTALVENVLPEYCNNYVFNSLTNVTALCNESFHRVLLISEGFIEIASCSDSMTFVLGFDHNINSLYLGGDLASSMGIKNVTENAFYIQKGSSVVLQAELFNSPPIYSQPTTFESKLNACEHINSSLVDNTDTAALAPFVMASVSYFHWSLSYWMDFCGLTPTTVYTWEILPINSNDGTDDNYNNDGICSVKYVNNGRYIEGSKRKSVVCLSDVMDEEYQVLKGEWNLHNEIQFVSSFGLPIDTGSQREILQRSLVYFREIIAVIRAFLLKSHLEHSTLYIKSFRQSKTSTASSVFLDQKPREDCCEEDCSIHDTILSLFLVYANVTNSESIWKGLINQLQCLLGVNADVLQQNYNPAIDRNLDYQLLLSVSSLVYDGSGAIKNICANGESYFCAHVPAKRELMMTFRKSSSLVRQHVMALVQTQHHNTIHAKDKEIVNIHQVSRSRKISPIVDGSVYVLIYVLPQHRDAADEIVDQMQAYLLENQVAYLSYLVFDVPIWNGENESLPSLRVVVDQTTRTIQELVTVQDIVVVLVGLDALQRFPPPGSNRLFPDCIYQENCYFHLLADIVVSSPICIKCDVREMESEFDFNAFVGVGSEVLMMLTQVKRHPLYPFSEDGTIRRILIEYALNHTMEVPLDQDSLLIDLQHHAGTLTINSKSPIDKEELFVDFKALLLAHSTFDNTRYDKVKNKWLVEKVQYKVEKILRSIVMGRKVCELTINILKVGAVDPVYTVESWSVQDTFNSIYQKLANHEWFAGVFQLVALTKLIVENGIEGQCSNYLSFLDDCAYQFTQFARQSKSQTRLISHDEFRIAALLMDFYRHSLLQHHRSHCAGELACVDVYSFPSCRCLDENASIVQRLEVALTAAQGVLYQATGSYDDMIKSFRASLNPEKYSVVRERRQEWRQQRAVLQQKYAGGKVVSDEVKIHFVTYATERNWGLDNLILSARVSLIALQIIGLGTVIHDYSDKINAYYQYMQDLSIADDDIVVLVDAYDVLLLPRARQIGSVLAQSEAPIMFCAEAGMYMTGALLYHRGSVNSHHNEYSQQDHMTQKALNSGCIAGRAGQLRHMFQYAYNLRYVFRDDQHVLVRYWQENPDMIALDVEHNIFLTTFKLNNMFKESGLSITSDLTFKFQHRELDGALQVRSSTSIGVLHCNSKSASNTYDSLAEQLHSHWNRFYSGNDGLTLIAAVNAFHDQRVDLALEYLNSVVVVHNKTSMGGVNDISDTLLLLLHN